jgi:hypothetical protein
MSWLTRTPKKTAKPMTAEFPSLRVVLHFEVPAGTQYAWAVRIVQKHVHRIPTTSGTDVTLKSWEIIYEDAALKQFSAVESMLSILEALESRSLP